MAKEKTPIQNFIIGSFMGLLLLFALVEVNFNVFNTFLGQNGAAAKGAGWTILEIVFLACAVAPLYFGAKSRNGVDNGHYIATGVFIVLAICAAAGFNFAIA